MSGFPSKAMPLITASVQMLPVGPALRGWGVGMQAVKALSQFQGYRQLWVISNDQMAPQMIMVHYKYVQMALANDQNDESEDGLII